MGGIQTVHGNRAKQNQDISKKAKDLHKKQNQQGF